MKTAKANPYSTSDIYRADFIQAFNTVEKYLPNDLRDSADMCRVRDMIGLQRPLTIEEAKAFQNALLTILCYAATNHTRDTKANKFLLGFCELPAEGVVRILSTQIVECVA